MKIAHMLTAVGIAIASLGVAATPAQARDGWHDSRDHRWDNRRDWRDHRRWDNRRDWRNERRWRDGRGWYGNHRNRCWTEWRRGNRVRVCR
ncbi:hypothetical protein [Sphingomonas montanisoli]|uniref:Uncharacterized protein n=1 Tax=Sphingomonas montanisoli TaxID=2606412 RepID=A0A5D9CEV5_9SPHN|nr:hypothetical protein [Sphingomonas montanisoli]TZG29530.1 hypothetical protein FYJ91_05255 [Sphingomonas montanisoli]